MQKKLRLLQADRYAYLVCAQIMSSMVVAYLEGRPAAKWLGCEQGAVTAWDDIVQELSDGTLHHTQIKRQTTDFSNDKAKRTPKVSKKQPPSTGAFATAKPASTVLRDLSSLDESIKALGEWFSQTTVSDGKARTFSILVPDRQVKIKNEFSIRNFEEFCVLCNNKTVTPVGLEVHAQSNVAVAHIYDWLTTWCGFTNWAHIHRALQNLKVEVKSLESEIERSTLSILERYFSPASDALKMMLHDLEYNVTDAGAATPRKIFTLISQFLRPEVPLWTQYALEDTSFTWGISGCASGHENGIENPELTVPIYWKDDIQSEKRLKLCVKFDQQMLSTEPLAPRLMRLALHLRGQSRASISELSSWNAAIRSALANTLGVTSDDLSDLPWVEAKESSYCVDSRLLPGIVDTNLECENFDFAMGKVIWELTKGNVSGAIRGLQSGDLQVGVDSLWRKTYQLLDTDLPKAIEFLSRMLNPSSEGIGNLGIMRVGPRTVDLVSSGLMMLMITAVALKRDIDIESLLSGNDIRVIALKYWGGPAASHRVARALVDEDDDTDVEDFFGKEVANIILVSGSRSSHSELNRFTIASDRSSQDSFGASRRAMLAVTNSRQFNAAVKSGTIQKVADLLEPELRLRGLAKEANIMKTELTK
jgi:hypothetical protein